MARTAMTRKRGRQFFRRGRGGRRRFGAPARRFVRRPTAVPRSLFGNQKMVVMRYHEGLSLSIGATGAPGVVVFSANGMFDPNQTAPGHQPRGFDEIMPLYDHYTVIGAKCTATFIPTLDIDGAGDSLGMMAGVSLRRSATPFTDQRAIQEDRNVTFGGLGNFNSPSRRFSRSFSARKFLGISHPMSETLIRGTQTANPGQQAFFHIWISPQAFAVAQGTWQVSVDIMYMAVFTEPKLPGES